MIDPQKLSLFSVEVVVEKYYSFCKNTDYCDVMSLASYNQQMCTQKCATNNPISNGK